MDTVSARVSSFLPSVKCSNCNVDIPISQMGDHTCSQAPPIPATRLNILHGPFAPDSKPAVAPKTDQLSPPRLNTIGSTPSVSTIRLPFALNSGSESSSRSASPIQSLGGRRSPYQLPPRSQTSPLPSRPPSDPITIPQDSPFPVFPTSTSRCATPVSPVEPKPLFSRTQTEPHIQEQPKLDEHVQNDNTSQKMSDNVPPLFSGVKTDYGACMDGHSKSTSISSSRASIGIAKFHMPRPSASSSVYTRNRSMSTVSGTTRSDWDAPDVPSMPSISGTEELVKDDRTPLAPLDTDFDFGLEKPKKKFSYSKAEEAAQKPLLEPSAYTHKPRPSVTAAMAPLNSIGSSSSFKPSRSLRGRKLSTTPTQVAPMPIDLPNGRDDKRLQGAPPVPRHLRISDNSPNPTHTPHESTSSNGSYSSGARSGSSRSSPPLQDSPRRLKSDAFESKSADSQFHDFQFGVENAPSQQERASYAINPQLESVMHESRYPSRPPSLSAEPTLPNILPPEPEGPPRLPKSPIRHDSSTSNSPDDYMIASNPASYPHSNGFHLSPTISRSPPYPSPPRYPPQRPRPVDKGPCRGCNEPIRGKSVSSADGRLTGRYHKGCFVCATCGNAFQTADFYVIDNQPYCARHYHELNNSLCQGCNKGIEGQFLETQSYRKFHSYCFTCQECHKILRDDYYEWGGRTLCGQHAFKAANQPGSSLGIGGARKFPERRTTKLMMM